MKKNEVMGAAGLPQRIRSRSLDGGNVQLVMSSDVLRTGGKEVLGDTKVSVTAGTLCFIAGGDREAFHQALAELVARFRIRGLV